VHDHPGQCRGMWRFTPVGAHMHSLRCCGMVLGNRTMATPDFILFIFCKLSTWCSSENRKSSLVSVSPQSPTYRGFEIMRGNGASRVRLSKKRKEDRKYVGVSCAECLCVGLMLSANPAHPRRVSCLILSGRNPAPASKNTVDSAHDPLRPLDHACNQRRAVRRTTARKMQPR
jgi:hypothetical protein